MRMIELLTKTGIQTLSKLGVPSDSLSELLELNPWLYTNAEIGVQNGRFTSLHEAWEGIIRSIESSRFVASGRSVFRLDRSRASQLLLTDVKDIVSTELKFPFSDFTIELPKRLLPMFGVHGEEFSTDVILVNLYKSPIAGDSKEQMRIHLTTYSDETPVSTRLVLTYKDWDRFSAKPFSVHDHGTIPMVEEDQVTFNAMVRLINGFLIWYEIESYTQSPFEHLTYRKKDKKRKERELPRVFVERRPIPIDSRYVESAYDFVRLGCKKPRAGWQITTQFVVRGHFYNQAYGPNLSIRRKAWRRPALKGADKFVMGLHSFEAATV